MVYIPNSTYWINPKNGNIELMPDNLVDDLVWRPYEVICGLDEKNGRIVGKPRKDWVKTDDLVWRPKEEIYALDRENGSIVKRQRGNLIKIRPLSYSSASA